MSGIRTNVVATSRMQVEQKLSEKSHSIGAFHLHHSNRGEKSTNEIQNEWKRKGTTCPLKVVNARHLTLT